MRILFSFTLICFSLFCNAGYVRDGDVVQVHYVGTLNDGSEFDSSKGKDPLEFKMGAGQMIPGFEKAVFGLKEGESKKVKIPCDQAYGKHNPDLIKTFDKCKMPDTKPGDKLSAYAENGSSQVVTVLSCDNDKIKIDANHPMAGKDLNFEIELVKIK